MKPGGEWEALSDSGVIERPLEPFPKSLWQRSAREARHGETHRPSALTKEN